MRKNCASMTITEKRHPFRKSSYISENITLVWFRLYRNFFISIFHIIWPYILVYSKINICILKENKQKSIPNPF